MTFQEFYSQYPKKVAKRDAEKAWGRMSEQDRAAAVAALPAHIKFWQARGDTQFIPYPSTWLNGARWEDEIEMPAAVPKQAVAWWASEQGVLAKGRELGIHARPGEEMAQFKARVVDASRKSA